MKIYAVRHGQADMDAEGRIQGSKSNLPLNETGRKQAIEAAVALSDKGIDLIVTSPMKPAMETAEIIAERLKIAKSEMEICTLLRERDDVDYEGMLMSEMEINAKLRWQDNAHLRRQDNAPASGRETIRKLAKRLFGFRDERPVNARRLWPEDSPMPGEETFPELTGRVFGFLDDRLELFKFDLERERFKYFYEEYEKQHGDDADYDTMIESVERSVKELKDIAILFVVHGHVLCCMYWYFNGMPSGSNLASHDDGGVHALGEEAVIEAADCGFYEFDTDKIPAGIKDYQVVLDRQILEAKLKRLSKSPYKANYNAGYDLCYMVGDDFEVTHENYSCPVCGNETEHTSGSMWSLNNAREAVMEITKSRIKIDAILDEREYCCNCTGESEENPQTIIKIRFSPHENYHEARTSDYNDYRCLTAFFRSLDEYEGGCDLRHPLIDHIDQIVKMTGLCPEIVRDWKKWVKKQKRWRE